MTELRGYQNKEAEYRLKIMGLPDDLVLCSSKGQKRRLGKSELYALKDIEKKYNIVIYHLILTSDKELAGAFDATSEYAYLYISPYEKNWEKEKENLRAGLCNAVCANVNDGMRVMSIAIKKQKSGGFLRVPVPTEEVNNE